MFSVVFPRIAPGCRAISNTRARDARRVPTPFGLASLAATVFLALCANPARPVGLGPITPIATVSFDRIDRFVAGDAFKPGHRTGGRTLSAVGWSFADHFLSVVEKDVPATTLRMWSLQYTMGDAGIIRTLGGEARASLASIAHVHRLMEAGDGPSHTDGRSNIAYVRSPIDKRLWAVHWSVNYSNEWTIGAVYVPHDHLDWHAETRLLSPMIGAAASQSSDFTR